MKRTLAVLLAIALLGIIVPVALADGPVWTWTGQLVVLDVSPYWWQYQPVTHCVYSSTFGVKYVPASRIFAGRLYCSPTIQ